jgi:hypothetical protein
MKITVDINAPKVFKRLDEVIKTKVQFAFDNQVMKDSNYYAPMDTGTLMASVITGYSSGMTEAKARGILQSGEPAKHAGKGKLIWNTPYAKRMYYGEGYDFSKDSNTNARAKWFEEAKAKKKGVWQDVLNKAVEAWK